jgi:hypothetical protein
MAKNRTYSYSDVDMLMTSRTISGSFNTLISELSAVRTNWTPEYATGLNTRIDEIIQTHLGTDAKKELRLSTTALKAIQVPANRDLSLFKTQIDEDFKNEPSRRDEILNTLGFTSHLKGVQKDNQESLIELLYQFKTNMDEPLKLEITGKGMAPALIDNITGYADTFMQANVAQETFKGSTKEITQEVIDTFNAVYDEIIGICKIASNYYQYEPLKKEQFTFSKVLARLGAAPQQPAQA